MTVKKILLVEDELISQQGQAAIFREAGYAVEVANNAHEALDLFVNEQFHMVFVDIGLPDMKGTELVKWLRAIEANGIRKPALIFIMSVYTKKKTKDKYLAAGANDVLEKPITMAVLKTKLKLNKFMTSPKNNVLNQNINAGMVNIVTSLKKMFESWNKDMQKKCYKN